jgi:large subunit ribosomal protein L29
MVKPKDLRVQSTEELVALEREKRKEIFLFRNSIANNDKEIKAHFVKDRKRDIARTLTVLTERKATAEKV